MQEHWKENITNQLAFSSLEEIVDLVNKTPYDNRSINLNIKLKSSNFQSMKGNELTDCFKIENYDNKNDILNGKRFLKINRNGFKTIICPIFRYEEENVQFIKKYIDNNILDIQNIQTDIKNGKLQKHREY